MSRSRLDLQPDTEVTTPGTVGGGRLAVLARATLLTAFLLSPTVALGSDSIQGAFGAVLGETIEGAGALGRAEEEPKQKPLAFTPTEPRSGFDEYFLEATPLTHATYLVAGRGPVASLSGCLKQRKRIAREMKQRYGPPESAANAITAAFGQDPSLVGRQGARTIRVECGVGDNGSQITLEYRDESLEDLARQEREALQKAKLQARPAK